MRQGMVFGRLQPTEAAKICDPGCFQVQCDLCEIQPPDFRQFLLRTVPVFLRRPEPKAHPGRRPARATRALISRGAADFINQQRVNAPLRVIARDARLAAINHAPDSVDGE
jgi:hypothetical protein